jgi:hypothetical protein
MSGIDQLLTLARAYGAAMGLEPSTVSWRVFGDTKKLAAIESGADIQVRRYERAVQWFSDNWPDGADWPAGVERPTGTAEEPVGEAAQ